MPLIERIVRGGGLSDYLMEAQVEPKLLDGQTAVVSGASSGIGAAVANHLAGLGAEVFSLDVQDPTAALSNDVVHVACDVTDDAEVVAAVETVKGQTARLDILVNNAGVASQRQAPLWELDLESWRRIYRVNVEGVFLLSRAVIPTMIDHRYGRIVNVASIAGMEGNARSAPYASSKAAVIAMTKSMGKELARSGVLVNVVTPTVFDTPLNGKVEKDYHDALVSRIPMGRMGDVSEAAEMIGFLASPKCSFSTGAVFDLSGGRAVY